MINCSKCGRDAVTYIRYNGTHLCREHFIEYIEKRVKKEIRRQKGKRRLKTISVALSGGKDSSVALYLTYKIFSKTADIHAITIDEGIKGYREKTLKIARSLCKSLGIDHHVLSFKKDIGITMDEIAKRETSIGTCTYCGIFRRNLLNKKAREIESDVLILGHNLDDFSQSILMNFVNADLEKLARMSPHYRIQKNLIPRILPLRIIPEKETMLYAMLVGLEVSLDECPYAYSSRLIFRRIINELEDRNPGTRHKILQSYDMIRPYLYEIFPAVELRMCKICGEPASKDVCKACDLRKHLDLI